MWKYLLFCLFISLLSCTGTNSNSEKTGECRADNDEIPMSEIQGQWDIENVVENDSSYVRPSEIEEGLTAYIDFRKDNTFGIMTNCNHLSGQYFQFNDSIRFDRISTTELACDNMELEEMLKKVLPMVNTIDCINDSITRLNSGKSESYIVLKKKYGSVK